MGRRDSYSEGTLTAFESPGTSSRFTSIAGEAPGMAAPGMSTGISGPSISFLN